MDIAFILPLDPYGFLGRASKSGRLGFARLTLTVLAALTPREHNVKILDARVHPIDYDMKVDIVGITALTSEIPSAYEIGDKFRAKGVTVVMGGSHVSALPDEALGHADAVVVGEAENVWQTLLDDFTKGALQKKYKFEELCDMDNMPIPRRELLDKWRYTSYNTLQATRGCPFDCNYCMVTKFFGRSFRFRPVEEVVEEIRRMDGKSILFLDDNIIGIPSYAKELFKALIPLKITWGGQASINLANDDELLSLYAESGGKTAFIGLESISQESLIDMNKKWGKADNYANAIKKIHKAGIGIIGSFVLGCDNDTKEVFEDTFQFVMRNKVDTVMYNILTPFPGTDVYKRFESENRIIERDWSQYTISTAVFTPKNMTAEELEEGYRDIYLRTYTFPNILRRNLYSLNHLVGRLALNYSYYRKVKRLFKRNGSN